MDNLDLTILEQKIQRLEEEIAMLEHLKDSLESDILDLRAENDDLRHAISAAHVALWQYI